MRPRAVVAQKPAAFVATARVFEESRAFGAVVTQKPAAFAATAHVFEQLCRRRRGEGSCDRGFPRNVTCSPHAPAVVDHVIFGALGAYRFAVVTAAAVDTTLQVLIRKLP